MFRVLEKWNPYLMADGGAGGGNEPDDSKPGDNDKPDDSQKESPDSTDKEPDRKYTDKDVDNIVAKKKAEWKAQEEKKIAEAKKLAEMNASEKAQYERDQAIREKDEANQKLALYEMTKEARNMLTEKGIAAGEGLLQVLVSPDAEKTKKAVDDFIEMFEKATEAKVKEALKGDTPPGGTGGKTLTKEDILKIKDPGERRKKMAEHMDLFN